mmetsp:Transcript_28115/g.44650  ORF Transcript_28115/g.44650 Transcript_28115/m.44650 type:complete len:601 (+) Transcript_28115:121-1923(+)
MVDGMTSKSVPLRASAGWLFQNGRFAERYDQLGSCLGSGGMGSVWAARVSSSGGGNSSSSSCPPRAAGTWVAVKAIPIELEDGERSAGNLHSGLRECLSTFRDLSPVHVVRYDCYWMEEQEHVPAEIRRFWERGRGVAPRLQPAREDPPSPSLPSNAVPAKDDPPPVVLPKMEPHRVSELVEEVPGGAISPSHGNDVVSLRFCEGADQERYSGLGKSHSETLSLRFCDSSGQLDRLGGDPRSPMYGMDRSSIANSTPKNMSYWPEPSMASNFTDCGFFFERASPSLGGSLTDHAMSPPERSLSGPSAVREATPRKRAPGRVVLLIEMELMGPKPSDSGQLVEKSASEWSSQVTEDRLTLRAWLTDPQRSRGRTFSHVADVFGMLMLSVRHIHRKRLVHADLKPDNIFIVAERSDERLKVSSVRIGDFGLAGENQLNRQQVYGKFSKSSPTGGTPGYVAPEVLSAEDCPVSDKSDIFACAVILLEILLPPCGTRMEWNGLLEGFRNRNAVPDFLEVRLPKTRALLRDMGAIDQTCRPSAEEVCKRFEKEVRKELSRLSVQRCCSPSVLRLETSRPKKNDCADHEDDRRHKKGKKSSKRRGR